MLCVVIHDTQTQELYGGFAYPGFYNELYNGYGYCRLFSKLYSGLNSYQYYEYRILGKCQAGFKLKSQKQTHHQSLINHCHFNNFLI